MNQDINAVASGILAHMEQAWNSADGQAFGEIFTEDADFIDIRGDYHRTRAAIAAGHQAILDTIYRDSVIRYELLQARPLLNDVALVHSSGTLNAPTGPLAGEHRAVQTIVMLRAGDAWRITAFQNTLVAPQPGTG